MTRPNPGSNIQDFQKYDTKVQLRIEYEILYNGDAISSLTGEFFNPLYDTQLGCYHPIKEKYVYNDEDISVLPACIVFDGNDHVRELYRDSDVSNHFIEGTTEDLDCHENRTAIWVVEYNSQLNISEIENSVKLFQFDVDQGILANYNKQVIGKIELIKVTKVFLIENNKKKKLATLTDGDDSNFFSSGWYNWYQENGWTVSVKPVLLRKAKRHEKLLEFDEAAEIYKKYGMDDDVIRVREEARNKVSQTVVHGDYVDDRDTTYIDDRDTIIKDSVISKSNIGAGGDDKFAKLDRLVEMKEKGLIDDDEFQQMKKEILK